MLEKGLLGQLIKSLSCLPGVGNKSAQRMAFYLLQRDLQGGKHLANTLLEAIAKIRRCDLCRTLTEQQLCDICTDQRRDKSTLCIVESPADVWVVEQAVIFKGLYFVLHGHLSPLDGIGPAEIGSDLLVKRFTDGAVGEIILATNSTVEGEATAHFIGELAQKHRIKASRIAHGVPMGSELEFTDSNTLIHAFCGRQTI